MYFRKNPLSLFIGSLMLFLLLQTLFSLWWRLQHDAALLQYIAHLILEQNRLPYRDIFDFNLPGTHLFFVLWIKIFGYSDLGFRLLDVIWSSAILSVVFRLLRRFGKQAAWMGVALIGLSYISFSPGNALQREWIIALPILLSVWLTVNEGSYPRVRIVAVGVLAGFVFLVKPHAVLFMLPLGMYNVTAPNGNIDKLSVNVKFKRVALFSALTGAGFMVALTPALIYLVSNNILDDLLEIMFSYLPQYSKLSGGHYLLTGLSRIEYLVSETLRLGGHLPWAMAAMFGSYLFFTGAKTTSHQRRIVLLYGGLSLVYAIYPMLSGQFWWYHWIPFMIFTIMLFCATAFNHKAILTKGKTYFLIGLTMCGLMFGAKLPVAPEFVFQLMGKGPRAPNAGRVDEIEAFLREHLRSGDTVQPLDWTSGAVHGMLRAKAVLATSFIWDMQFYHHVDSQFNQNIRRRFIDELTSAQPRFIIEVFGDDKPWPMGIGTTKEFPELQAFLVDKYNYALKGDGYQIHELRTIEKSNP